MALWPFKDRRKHRRYVVDWQGILSCRVAERDIEEELSADVLNISIAGACLAVPRLQVGPIHLVIGDRDLVTELSFPVEGGSFRSFIGIVSYNWCTDTRRFLLNTVFRDMSDRSRDLLRDTLLSL